QRHAEHALGLALYVLDGAHDLHAAALAAPAGVDLCLHHPDRAAQLRGGSDRFIDDAGGLALGVLRSAGGLLLCGLAFVGLHGVTKSWTGRRIPTAGSSGNTGPCPVSWFRSSPTGDMALVATCETKNDTGNKRNAGVRSIPKFARSRYGNDANFGIGTP